MPAPQTFGLKMDLWLVVVAGVALLAGIFAAFVSLATAPLASVFALVLVVGIVVLIRLISLPCSFQVDDEGLVIRAGITTSTIPFDRLVAVYPTKNPLSSPYAWSLDRVRVDFVKEKGGTSLALLSVEDKEGFIEALATRSPYHVLVEGKAVKDEPAPSPESTTPPDGA